MPRTVFHSLLDSSLPPEEKSVERLWQEAQVIIGAGTDTTANTLAVTTFHLLNNPKKNTKLRKELETAFPDRHVPLKLTAVEQLPYLVSFSILTVSERVSLQRAYINPIPICRVGILEFLPYL